MSLTHVLTNCDLKNPRYQLLTRQQEYNVTTGAHVQPIPQAVSRGLADTGAPKVTHLNRDCLLVLLKVSASHGLGGAVRANL
jgi:hypothetical protein